MVPWLHNLVLTATPEQLGKEYGGGRRNLVVEASEIAAFPQWFVFAEEILFTLARHETSQDSETTPRKYDLDRFPSCHRCSRPLISG